jgi:ribonuclease I
MASFSQSFTIHGYWPSASSRRTFGSFDVDLLDAKLFADMNNYWPPQSRNSQRSPTFLWEHEYDAHGSDFANIYLQQHNADFSNLSTSDQDNQLQQIFFRYVVDLYLTINVRKLAKNQYSKEEFAKSIGLKSNQFNLICNQGSGTLQEIRICFNITPKKSYLMTCSNTQSRNCNNDQVVLSNWKKTAQAQVFKA